jgi:4'-phosphopantetheinyl transferase
MATSLPWLPAAKPPALAEKELHVWRASLELSPENLERLETTLNAEEKARAGKFLVPRARESFIAARGILRELLGAYLGIGADQVAFRYGAQGKPLLAPSHDSRISFNTSHSLGIGLFAFAHGGEIGVDIEQVRTDFKGMEIASRFFSEHEISELRKLPAKEASEAFFGCWTRKEAYVKAHGEGLSIPLRSFTVSFAKQEQVLEADGSAWSCHLLEPAPGFAGAVVARGENWRVRCWGK